MIEKKSYGFKLDVTFCCIYEAVIQMDDPPPLRAAVVKNLRRLPKTFSAKTAPKYFGYQLLRCLS